MKKKNKSASPAPFSTGKQNYRSDIVLGDRYRDKDTGIEGVAVAVSFFRGACERVVLKRLVDDKISEMAFDATELVHIETGKTPEVEKTGGPDRAAGIRER